METEHPFLRERQGKGGFAFSSCSLVFSQRMNSSWRVLNLALEESKVCLTLQTLHICSRYWWKVPFSSLYRETVTFLEQKLSACAFIMAAWKPRVLGALLSATSRKTLLVSTDGTAKHTPAARVSLTFIREDGENGLDGKDGASLGCCLATSNSFSSYLVLLKNSMLC